MRALVTGGGTGGHLMPSLALAEELRSRGVEVLLIGAHRGIESQVLPERDFDYKLLDLHPLYRNQPWKNLGWIYWAPSAMLGCRKAVKGFAPDVVVSTGGYAAGPVAATARLMGIPLVVQEQNAFPGVTSRLTSRWAERVYLGFPEAADRLPIGADAVVESGNPITPPTGTGREEARRKLGIPEDRFVVAVSGGSQGSRAVNRVVAAAIEAGSFDEVTLIWGVGHRTYPEFKRYHSPPDRILKAFWDPMSDLYAAAEVIVGRSGAMSVAEFCAWGIPSILVPLPSAAADHQTANARAMADAGASVWFPERELTPKVLAGAVQDLMADPERLAEMARVSRGRGRPGAASEIVSDVLSLVS